MPRAIRGLIFDIDGTLIDSNDLHAQAWQEAFAEFGKEIAYDVIRSHIGKGGDLLIPDLLNARQMRELGTKLRHYRKQLFRRKFLPKARPFPREN
ncbi:MAG TPA: HAD hydrolase-like protein [Thermoanaerobaculia bacterium]